MHAEGRMHIVTLATENNLCIYVPNVSMISVGLHSYTFFWNFTFVVISFIFWEEGKNTLLHLKRLICENHKAVSLLTSNSMILTKMVKPHTTDIFYHVNHPGVGSDWTPHTDPLFALTEM